LKIIIETIPHLEQRYNTCGDWQWENKNTLHIKVSTMEKGNFDQQAAEMIVGLHEAIEALICRTTGVTEEQVDEFDNNKKLQKQCDELEIEPGDHPKAPYKTEHLLATGIEKILCVALKIPWFEYEGRLIEMTDEYEGNKHD
jgi:hypothetical protein